MSQRKRTRWKLGLSLLSESQFRSGRAFKKLYQVYQGSRPQGHAAEHMNHLADSMRGQKGRVLHSQALYSPDRVTTVKGREIYLQTKFCGSSDVTAGSLFESGRYRYFRNGKYVPSEVPADQYSEVLNNVERRIVKGQCPGLKPGQARMIIRKSLFTYEEAVRVTKALTPESVFFDVTTGILSCAPVGGLSLILTFFLARSEGHGEKASLKIAARKASKMFTTQLLIHVATHQMSRSALIRYLQRPALMVAMRTPVLLRNSIALTVGSVPGTIGAIGGTARLIQSTVVSTIASTTILSLNDFRAFFCGELAGFKLLQKLVVRGVRIGAATAGNILGRALLGVIGFFNPFAMIVGGLFGATISQAIVDLILPDEEVRFKKLLNDSLSEACVHFKVTSEELEEFVLVALKIIQYEELLTCMKRASDPKKFARTFSRSFVLDCLTKRRAKNVEES